MYQVLFNTAAQKTPSDGLMLGQRRRCWSNIKPALGLYLVFAGCKLPEAVNTNPGIHEALSQCYGNSVTAS